MINMGNTPQETGKILSQPSSSPKHCLAEFTRVRMADFGVKCIQDIVPGDMVLGVDDCMKPTPVKVVQTSDQGYRACVDACLENSARDHYISLSCTAECKILCMNIAEPHNAHTNDSFDCTDDFRQFPIGTIAYTSATSDANARCYRPMTINESYPYFISEYYDDQPEVDVYGIDVDSHNHLFVLANGLIVSNAAE